MQPGDTVTYTLTVTNDSDGVRHRCGRVTDDLSDVLEQRHLRRRHRRPGGSLDRDHPDLGGADARSPAPPPRCRYTVTVNADAFNETIGNVATPGPGGECVAPADCDTTHPTPHYTLTKTSDPVDGSTVQPGDTVSYTLTVTNDSDGVVTGAVVTDDLSDVLNNAISTDRCRPAATLTGTTLTWTVPTLQPGGTSHARQLHGHGERGRVQRDDRQRGHPWSGRGVRRTRRLRHRHPTPALHADQDRPTRRRVDRAAG